MVRVPFRAKQAARNDNPSSLQPAGFATKQSGVLPKAFPLPAALGFLPGAALAHAPGPSADTLVASLAAVLAVALVFYTVGWRRLRAAHGASAVARRRALYFFLGIGVLIAALLPPLDTLAERSFALHMIQHQLLMLAAAPLLVLARPLAPYLHALPPAARRPCARWLHRGWLARLAAGLTGPLVAWSIYAGALWLWHAPLAFNAALADSGIHVVQHASFFIAAVIYWWSVLPGRAEAAGVGVLSLFGTILHGNVLGALLTFAPVNFYAYRGIAGLSALEDQQLGGLIMWIPAGAVYLGAGLALFMRLLRPRPGPSRYA